MKRKIISTLALAALFVPLAAQALTLNLRGGYRSGSHAYETLIGVSQGWDNGWWASFSTNSWNGIHNNSNELIGLSYNEIDTNYTWKLDDKWSLKPGVLTNWKSAGTRFGPYLKLSYDVSKDINLAVRYRYDYNVNRAIDLDGNRSRANQHRWDGYFTYKMDENWTFAWQTTVYTSINNFKYNNNKRHATENAFVLLYKASPTFTPYIEYDYLDKQGAYNGRKNLTENSYRVGVLINL